MNSKNIKHHTALIVALLCSATTLAARTESISDVQQVLEQKLDANSTAAKSNKTIRINYNNEELIDIINTLAAEKNVNVIVPTGTNTITSKVTFSLDERVSLDEAWQLLYTILDVAGYTMLPKEDMFVIVKNSNQVIKEPLPIYIATPVEKLPKGDERIRYLYYLTNLKVPTPDQESNSEINSVLKLMLPDTSALSDGSSKIVYDQATNGVLITEKANNIRAAVNILAELDRTGFKEVLEVVKIVNTSAERVRKLLMDPKDGILATREDAATQYQTVGKKTNDASYFSKDIKAYAEERSNSLILLGRQEAIARVVKFIKEEIDRPLDPGRSVMHVYQLLYLDAGKAATMLDMVINARSDDGGGQSRAVMTKGTERFFKNVLINADSFAEKQKEGAEGLIHPGSNKLLITCSNSDWQAIKRLIEEIDIPQPQVILEVLVADITMSDPKNKQISSITRNPINLPLLNGVNGQAANLGGPLLDPTGSPELCTNTADPVSLTPDLLSKFTCQNSLATLATPGSTLFALGEKNGDVWSLLQVLQSEENIKILSNPHLIAINNQKASVEIGESRLVQGSAKAESGGGIKIDNKLIKANLKVEITPLINSADQLNLKVKIDIDEFSNTGANASTDGNRLTRNIYTEANVKSGEVLALGGLIKTTTTETLSGTPILSKLPIVGWLFKRRTLSTVRSNLTVFITPTIIQPKLRGGMSDYTQDYIKLSKKYAQDTGLFETLRDPITRWFFESDLQEDISQIIDNFTVIDELKTAEMNAETPTDLTDSAGQPLEQPVNPKELQQQEVAFNNFVQEETGLMPFNLEKELLATAHTTPANDAPATQQETVTADVRKVEYEQQLKDLLQFEENPFAALA